MVWPCTLWLGWGRQGIAGEVRWRLARAGQERHGLDWSGMERQARRRGLVRWIRVWIGRQGGAGLVVAWHGVAGKAWHGSGGARQGAARCVAARLGVGWCGRQGEARHELVGY